jgi:hypothetical protein
MSWLSDIYNQIFRRKISDDIYAGVDSMLQNIPIIHSLMFDSKPHDGFMPSYPEAEREVLWSMRNPFQGLTKALAIQGPYTTVGPTVSVANPHGTTWAPNNAEGPNWLLHTDAAGNRYPFFSYRSQGVEFYSGWRPDSKPGFAARKEFASGV